ncbi:hypothetical protein CAC42_2554 [Sphaceloma murrayae]|uniref:Uncharacterized protein n=1 Tax=Sphaceloma murrayae TaxID=2082308 RepID=A0A2K1QWF3_9PEZI|nr:hypothetical protein CAC42_2554 [Sphaceloma murrayae]
MANTDNYTARNANNLPRDNSTVDTTISSIPNESESQVNPASQSLHPAPRSRYRPRRPNDPFLTHQAMEQAKIRAEAERDQLAAKNQELAALVNKTKLERNAAIRRERECMRENQELMEHNGELESMIESLEKEVDRLSMMTLELGTTPRKAPRENKSPKDRRRMDEVTDETPTKRGHKFDEEVMGGSVPDGDDNDSKGPYTSCLSKQAEEYVPIGDVRQAKA